MSSKLEQSGASEGANEALMDLLRAIAAGDERRALQRLEAPFARAARAQPSPCSTLVPTCA